MLVVPIVKHPRSDNNYPFREKNRIVTYEYARTSSLITKTIKSNKLIINMIEIKNFCYLWFKKKYFLTLNFNQLSEVCSNVIQLSLITKRNNKEFYKNFHATIFIHWLSLKFHQPYEIMQLNNLQKIVFYCIIFCEVSIKHANKWFCIKINIGFLKKNYLRNNSFICIIT